MWAPLAAELSIPWRAAEAMHWQLGEADMARRAGVVPFSLAASASASSGGSNITSGGSGMVQQQIHSPAALSSGSGGAYNMPGTLGIGGPQIPSGPPPTSYPMTSGSYHDTGRGGGRRESAIIGPAGGGLPSSLAGSGPGSSAGHGVLPSLAELERGMTAYDSGRGGEGGEQGRFGDPRR